MFLKTLERVDRGGNYVSNGVIFGDELFSSYIYMYWSILNFVSSYMEMRGTAFSKTRGCCG